MIGASARVRGEDRFLELLQLGLVVKFEGSLRKGARLLFCTSIEQKTFHDRPKKEVRSFPIY